MGDFREDKLENFRPFETCVVAFASNDDPLGEGVKFEFGNTLEDMDVAYVLFRDSTGYRLQYGVLGIGPRAKLVEYLLDLSRKYKRLVLTGVSAGGSAAIMYSQLMAMKVGSCPNVEVIMISPYSDLGDPFGAFGQDWMSRGPWAVEQESLLVDLSVIFDNGPLVKTRAFYSDGDGAQEDVRHAYRIGVTDLTFIPGASHSGLGKLMRDLGKLQKVLMGERI